MHKEIVYYSQYLMYISNVSKLNAHAQFLWKLNCNVTNTIKKKKEEKKK